MKATTSQYMIIRSSGIHNKGVFAKKDIPKDARVIEYVGEKLSRAKSDKRADVAIEAHEKNAKHGAVYIFELNKRQDIDGNVPWNTARYINHSCDPNCETDIIRGKIWIIALRDINKGEELSYDYNYDPEDFKDHPCKCGAKKCLGYIVGEDFRPKVKRMLKKAVKAC